MSCEHTKLHVEADPCMGRVWTASCTECEDGEIAGDPAEYRRCGGVSGSGRTKLEALRALRNDILGDEDESPNTATVDTLIAEQEMIAAADRMAAKSREVLAAFKGAR